MFCCLDWLVACGVTDVICCVIMFGWCGIDLVCLQCLLVCGVDLCL